MDAMTAGGLVWVAATACVTAIATIVVTKLFEHKPCRDIVELLVVVKRIEASFAKDFSEHKIDNESDHIDIFARLSELEKENAHNAAEIGNLKKLIMEGPYAR